METHNEHVALPQAIEAAWRKLQAVMLAQVLMPKLVFVLLAQGAPSAENCKEAVRVLAKRFGQAQAKSLFVSQALQACSKRAVRTPNQYLVLPDGTNSYARTRAEVLASLDALWQRASKGLF